MKTETEEIILPWWQKLIALVAVCALALLVFLIPGWLGFKGNEDSSPNYSSCETMTNPTPCGNMPDPNEESMEEIKKYPDVTPYDEQYGRNNN